MASSLFDAMLLVVFVFLLAGFVKGIIGFGLPTVSVSLLTAFQGLEAAIVIMLLPSLLTNVWQGVVGGHFVYLIRRFLWLLVFGVLLTWITSRALTGENLPLFVVLLGVAIVVSSGSSILGLKIPDPGRHERWLSPAIGGISGGISGVTGVFVLPAVDYLRALALGRDQLIQVMGIWFSVATISLGSALSHHGLVVGSLGLLSAVGIVPAFIGMILGRRLRTQLSPDIFRTVFLIGLSLVGLYLIVMGLSSHISSGS